MFLFLREQIMEFETLVDQLIDREGGYVNNPGDAGGATRFGITEGIARRHGFVGDMRCLPRTEAVAIYRRLYWLRPGYDKVAALAPRIAAELFDTAVNMGVGVASGFLQRALNALNRNGRDYRDLAVDRAIGPRTLSALEAFLTVRGASGESVLLKAIEALQGARYIDLAERRPANEAFLYGWLANRIG
jgi:lysozyme family protein